MGSERDTQGRAGAQGSEGGFSLELSEDLRDMRDWVHDFAATVIRPAGAEWDEREETPWPVLEAASKIGLYSLDLSQGQKFRKHGIRASHTAEVVLDDVRVPGNCLVGGKERLDERLARVREGGRGGDQAAMKTFEASRPGVAAMAVGVGRAAVEYAAAYSRDRVQFGHPIGQNQGVAFMLADMQASVDAARLLTWRAAWMARHSKPFSHAEG